MAKEMPPKNFPIDDEGNKICAKCNSRSGCTRPVMDQHNSNLRNELFDVEQLYTFDEMSAWIENAQKNQRCIWGVHKPISKDMAIQFNDWFKRSENNGFQPYDTTFYVLSLVKELLNSLYEKAYKNEKEKKGTGLKLTKKQKNDLLYQINGVERAYMDMDGSEPFHFMVDCDRDTRRCNERREFEGNNHQHPYELEGTEIDKETYAEVADLRKRCIDLGIDPKTGPQRDLDRTVKILQKRIDVHAEKKASQIESKKRNEGRSVEVKETKDAVKVVAGDQLSKHMGNACSANDITKILSLIKRGANPNIETPRGMRPLLVVIVNNGNPDQIGKVIKGGAYVNACNRNGLTALMLACRLRDTRLVHLLLQNGADEITSEGRLGSGRTALHFCAIHGAEDEAQALFEYVKDGEGEDVMRMMRFLDYQDKNGDSPLMVAARNRNGLMCYNLIKMGADPKVMNSQKQNAAYIAREYSYGALADYLESKGTSGISNVETFSDLQFEKVHRFSGLKLMELIQQFCNKILKLLQGRNNVTMLMCPSRIQEFADMYGDNEKHQLVNRYFFFILMQQPNNADTTAMIDSMKKIVQDIVKVVREGNVYPSAEALEKPLPWTSLMCAVAINDSRSMRLICHEGADPNYQNRHGMTALMLAAQLNNIEAICELLLLGSDINVVDNEGYNAYAYAVSLPYAKPLQRSASNVLTDGDNEATKRYTADEVLKMAVTLTPVEIKVRVKANLKKCTAVEIKREMDRLKILEKNGLSKVKTEDDIHHSVASSHWRIDPEKSLELFGEDCYGDADKKISVHDAVSKLRDQEKKKGEKPRCPICTLALPCKHFKKASQAKEYAKKKEREELLAIEKKKAKKKRDEEYEDEDDDEDPDTALRKNSALYEKESNTDISENENLRMQLEIEKERAQILAERLEKEENESDGLNNLPPRTPVKVKLRRQLHEEQQRSKELAKKLEDKKNEREKENKKKANAKDYESNAKKNSSKHPHTPVTSKLLKELEDEKQKAIELAEELERVKNDPSPKTPENSERAKVRKELEKEKDKTKSLENALDRTKKRIKEDTSSPLKKKKGKHDEDKKKDKSSKKSSKSGKSVKYTVESDDDDDDEGDDEEDDELVMSSKNKASKLRKKLDEERRKKEEAIRRKEEKKRALEKARKEEEKRKKKEEAEKRKARELERRKKEAEKARLKEVARIQREKEARQRRKEEEHARKLAKQAKEKAMKIKAEQKAQETKIKKEREKMRVKLMELQSRLNKKEIDDNKKHKKSRDKKSLEKSANEYRRMKKEIEMISAKLNKTNRRANDAESRLGEMVELMNIKKEIEDHNSKIAEATSRKSTLAKKLLNHMGDAVLYSEAGFSEDAQQFLQNKNVKEGKKEKSRHRHDDSDDDDDARYRSHNKPKTKKGKLLEVVSHSKKKSREKSKSRRKRYETSDDESISVSDSGSDLSSSDRDSDSETETSIEDVGIQIDESSEDDSGSDLESVSDMESSYSGNDTEASGYYDSDSSRPVSRSIMKRDTGEKKYKSKTRVLKFNINNKILTNLPKGEKKIKVAEYHEALNRPETADTEGSISTEGEESDDSEESTSGSEVHSESDLETEAESVESEVEDESEEEMDYKALSRKTRGKMAKWMNKL